MPRAKKKPEGKISPDVLKTGVLEVVEKGRSIRSVAVELNLKKSTLQRYVKKYKAANEAEKASNFLQP